MKQNNTTLPKNDNLILVNITEEFVREQTRETIKELGACDCDTCYLNACAIALNNLPAKYVTTTRGALLSRLAASDLGSSATILVEVTKAVMKIMKNPHHD